MLMRGSLVAIAAFLFVNWPVDERHRLPGFHALGRENDRLNALYPLDLMPGGNDVELPHGNTRYYLSGRNATDPATTRLVLVHGIGTPSPVFRLLVEKLVSGNIG